MFHGFSLVYLLTVTDRILTTTPQLDEAKVRNARDTIENVIVENFDQLLERISVYEYDGNGSHKLVKYTISQLKDVKAFFTDKEKINAKLAEAYDTISKCVGSEEIIDFLNIYSDINVDTKEISVETIMAQTFSEIKDENLQWAISGVAKELLQSQQLKPNQMEILGSGYFSNTIKIGDYVLKVGEKRNSSVIYNDERVIQPLFSSEFQGEHGKSLVIEVQDLVEKEWYKGLSEKEIDEELYKIYSDMRSRGIRWRDVKKENVGRLLKPNTGIYNINEQELKGTAEAMGVIEKENNEPIKALDAGELVVIDRDYIDDESQEIKVSARYSLHRGFEKRYLEEKAAREANEKVAEPKLLNSAIELSKAMITHEDILAGAQAIKAKDEINKEFEEKPIEETNDESRE